MTLRWLRLKSSVITLLMLSGCGRYVPEIQEFWETKNTSHLSAGGLLAYKVKEKVYCGIVEAVIASRNAGVLPRGWAVQVTLNLQVDETGATNPGVSFINPLAPGETFTFGLGATLSSAATREDKFGSYWNLEKLTSLTGTPCEDKELDEKGSSLLLQSDLKIQKWLLDNLTVRFFTPSSELSKNADNIFKQESLAYHVKFVVVSSANATPTWKLVGIATGNGSQPLISANRTRAHDLLITFGPAFKAGTPNIAVNSHAAQEFGIAISNGNRAPGPSATSQ